MRSYRPEQHFAEDEDSSRSSNRRRRRVKNGLGRPAIANGGRRLRPLEVPGLDPYSVAIEARGRTRVETTRPFGELLRDLLESNRGRFRLFCPDETNSNRLGAVFEVEDRCLMDARPDDESTSAHGRVMEVLSEHLCQGWLEGYLLSGRGLFATYEAFAMVSASMAIQHAKWLEEAEGLEWREPVGSLNVLLTSTCWRNDHNGPTPRAWPDRLDDLASGRRARLLPPDANSLLGCRPLPRQPQLREPDCGRQAASPAVPGLGGSKAAGGSGGVRGTGRAMRPKLNLIWSRLRRRRPDDGDARCWRCFGTTLPSCAFGSSTSST